MKNLIIVLCAILLLAGCAGISIKDDIEIDTQTLAVLAAIASRNIGCEIAKASDTEIDKSLRNIYLSVRNGELTPEAMQQLAGLTKTRPTLAADISSLLKLAGLNISLTDEQMSEIGIQPIPEEIYQAVENGYVMGIMLCEGI